MTETVDDKNKTLFHGGRHNVFLGILCAYLLLMVTVLLLSTPNGKEAIYSNPAQLVYTAPDPKDAYMMQTDAFAKGQLALDITPSEELLALENPYDPEARTESQAEYTWDFAFYQGKYYSYFGVVPVVLVLLPFRLLTGCFLSSYYFAAFLGLLAAAALAFLYRALIRFFLPRLSPLLYYMGEGALLVGSNLLFLSARSWFYEIPYNSGLLFVFLSLLLLLRACAKKERRRWALLFSGLCLGLSVGCRPVYLLCVLLHLPFWLFLLRQEGKSKQTLQNLLVYLLPLAGVGGLLGLYNQPRFGSFLQFGAIYQLTVSDISKNSIFDLPKQVEGVLRYLFQPVQALDRFPFLALSGMQFTPAANEMYSHPVAGQLLLPVVWGIFTYPALAVFSRKTDKKEPDRSRQTLFLRLIPAVLICGLLTMLLVIGQGGIMERYTLDFQWLFILAGVLSALGGLYQLKKRGLAAGSASISATLYQNGKSVFYLVVVLTLLLLVPIGMMGEFCRML